MLLQQQLKKLKIALPLHANKGIVHVKPIPSQRVAYFYAFKKDCQCTRSYHTVHVLSLFSLHRPILSQATEASFEVFLEERHSLKYPKELHLTSFWILASLWKTRTSPFSFFKNQKEGTPVRFFRTVSFLSYKTFPITLVWFGKEWVRSYKYVIKFYRFEVGPLLFSVKLGKELLRARKLQVL